MPKIRTNRCAAKRFRQTGGGGLKRAKAYASHLLSDKTRKRKRRLRKGASLEGSELRRMKRLMARP